MAIIADIVDVSAVMHSIQLQLRLYLCVLKMFVSLSVITYLCGEFAFGKIYNRTFRHRLAFSIVCIEVYSSEYWVN